MKNRVLKILVAIVLVVSFIGVFFVMSIMDLMNTKDVYERHIDVAGELLVVENSINGIIPTGKDYYYVGLNDETGEIYTIHAGKKWLEKNFDPEGNANGNGVSIKGLSKRANDFKVEKELANRITQIADDFGEYGYELAQVPGHVLEINYVRDAIMKIFAGILILGMAALYVVFKKKADVFPAWTGKAILAGFVLILIFSLWTIL